MQSSSRVFILLLISTIVCAEIHQSETKKPMCGLCVKVVKELEKVIANKGNIEKAVHQLCKREIVPFVVRECEKLIEKNLQKIIEKLLKHEDAHKICHSISVCVPVKKFYFLEIDY